MKKEINKIFKELGIYNAFVFYKMLSEKSKDEKKRKQAKEMIALILEKYPKIENENEKRK